MLLDGVDAISKYVGKPFGTIFTTQELANLRNSTNKGVVGQLLERAIGLQNTSTTLDFVDGEMKSYKSKRDGNPDETVFITQMLSQIDHILAHQPFQQTPLFKKTRNLALVPIYKHKGVPVEQWMIVAVYHVNLAEPKWTHLATEFESDYRKICLGLNDHINTSADGYIHTTNGTYIQVRSKDSKPYSPIFSTKYGRNVSNKNHAFYFKKSLMQYVKQNSP